MPWCDDCSKFWNPNTIPPDGTCPTCGRIIAEPPESKVPWHFWVLIVSVVAYLGWRLVQGINLLVENDHPVLAALAALTTLGVIVGAAAWNWWPERDGDGDGSGGGAGAGSGSSAGDPA